MTSKNIKKVESINNSNIINTKLKIPVPIRPKPTVLEQYLSLPSIPSIDITSKPASTSEKTTIDLTEVHILLLFA